MKQLNWTDRAVEDLVNVWRHIARDNVSAANRIFGEIEDRCELLPGNPYLGRSRDDVSPGMRAFVHGNYVIYYLVTEDEIAIIRILHGARKYEDLFDDEMS